MLTCIGYEGSSMSGIPTTFGCAALWDGYHVWNSCTWAKCEHSRWLEYVANGNATACPESPALPGIALFQSRLLVAPKGFVSIMITDNMGDGLICDWTVGPRTHGWLFESLKALKATTIPAAAGLVAQAEVSDEEEKQFFLQQAYVLDYKLYRRLAKTASFSRP